MTHKIKLFAVSMLAGLMLSACGSDRGGVTSGVSISLTDAPACGYDAVNVTVKKVRIHQSSAANDNDSGWYEIALNPARRVNLVNLTNGVLDKLGETPLPAGKYTQLRLVLADNTAATPFANSVVPTGKQEVALTTPSANKSGEKLIHPFDVAEGTLADVVLDFDACKSIVPRGNGAFNLKPVISVAPIVVSGAITGFIDSSVLKATVTAQQAGKVVKATFPDATTGKYTLGPLLAGTYDVVVVANDRASAVITGVPVVAKATVQVSGNTNAAPAISLPASASGAASGNVTFSTVAPTDGAQVRATQTLTGGTVYEVRFVNANATTGAYSFTVPLEAPRVGAYSATLPVALVADAPAAGKYTMEANATGFAKSASAVTVTSAGVVQNFTLAP